MALHMLMHCQMNKNKMVNIQQMKDALMNMIGSKFPLKITLSNGDVMVRYIRGFADQQTNILLISENAYTLALRILEVKEIRTLEFAEENTGGEWKVLHAKWLRRQSNLSN